MAQRLSDTSKRRPSATGNATCQGALRAWLQRSATQNTTTQSDDVTDFFDPFPFDWQVPLGRPSQIKIFYLWLWRWRTRDSSLRSSACSQMLHHALSRSEEGSRCFTSTRASRTSRAHKGRRDQVEGFLHTRTTKPIGIVRVVDLARESRETHVPRGGCWGVVVKSRWEGVPVSKIDSPKSTFGGRRHGACPIKYFLENRTKAA